MITIPDEIKEILHRDSAKKNIRIHFPNGDRADICNDLIVENSVSFTESICSQNELKFGLCESPEFECEVVGVGNIKGATIEVSCEIYCDSTVEGAVWRPDLMSYVYPIPYGVFTVDSCKRQADMIHRKIVAYNYMMSNPDRVDPAIDAKANIIFSSQVPYQPNIIATSLNNFGAKTRLNGTTYTESVQSITGGKLISTYQVSYGYQLRGNINFRLLTRIKLGPENNQENLFYLDYKFDRSPQEAFSDVCQQIKADTHYPSSYISRAINQFEKAFTETNFSRIWRLLTTYSEECPFSDSNYLYSYQMFNNASYRSQVEVIVGFTVRIKDNVDPYEASYTSKFIDDSDDSESLKVYDVDISSFPEYRLDVPRNVYTTNTERGISGYVFDRDKIDYFATLKDAMELFGLFWYTTREGGVKLLNIKQQFGLTPSGSLYPGSSTHPQGVTGGKLLPEDYQSCWYDDEYIKPYGAVRCKYKDTNNQDQIYTLYLQGYNDETDSSNYQIYELSGNSIIDGSTWTESQIQTICNNIANNIFGVTFMPVEFVGRGLPYVEAGDTFEILTKSYDSITTIVLNRTLAGEQTLTDTYKSV